MAEQKRLNGIASRQNGYFTARQASSAGYSNDLQGYHVRNGHWVRIDRGVFRLAGYPDTDHGELISWMLRAQGRSEDRLVVVSHESALHYYGLEDRKPPAVHLTVSQLPRGQAMTGCVFHLDPLQPHEYQRQQGLRVTTPLRTLQDLKPDLVYRCAWAQTVQRAVMLGLLVSEEVAALGAGDSAARAPAAAMVGEERRTQQMAGTLLGRQTGLPGEVPAGLRPVGAERAKWLAPSRSFTLVEMLVVIAIIGILAALLMPGLNSAMNSSQQANCASRLRQIGIGAAMYANDNNGWVTMARYDSAANPTYRPWMVYLIGSKGNTAFKLNAVYVDDRFNFSCPSFGPAFDPTESTLSNSAYGSERNHLNLPAMPTASINKLIIRLDNVDGKRVLWADTAAYRSSGTYSGKYIQWHHFFSNSVQEASAVHLRHNERTNGLYHDGHVTACGFDELDASGIKNCYTSNLQLLTLP